MEVTRTDQAGARELRMRWEAHRRTLAKAGAPEPVLDAVQEAVEEPTGVGGRVGRLVIAEAGGQVLVNAVLGVAPGRDEAVWAPIPHLLPAVRALAEMPSYLLVTIDRTGADIELHHPLDNSVETSEVTGEHDVLHKVPGGGYSSLRFQNRVEDSWERNATEVAHRVAKLERAHRPAAVLVSGDSRAVGHFLEHAAAEVRAIATHLETGGRAEGTSAEALKDAVWTAMAERRHRTQTELVERYQRLEGRQERAVQSLEDVVDALRRGQVEDILLHDDPSSDLRLWLGEGPLEIALEHRRIAEMGSAKAVSVRADSALAWAALASEAGFTVLDGDDPKLMDGIGATLRWSDRSTPHEAVPSMPGHGEPGGGEPVV